MASKSTRMIYSRPDPDMTAGRGVWVDAFLNQILGLVADEIEWIDPDGGPNEEDPELHPDLRSDDPLFNDETDDDQEPIDMTVGRECEAVLAIHQYWGLKNPVIRSCIRPVG